MSRPESTLHDPGIHRTGKRECPYQAATGGNLNVPTQSIRNRMDLDALRPHPGARPPETQPTLGNLICADELPHAATAIPASPVSPICLPVVDSLSCA